LIRPNSDFQPVPASLEYAGKENRCDIMGLTKDFVALRYNIPFGESIQAEANLAREHASSRRGCVPGEVQILDENGNVYATIKQGDQRRIYYKEFLKLGRYTIKNTKPGVPAVVYTQYRPLRAESLVYEAFDAIKSNLAAIQSNKVRILAENNMYKGDTTTPGSLGYERKVLSSISNGTVTLSSWISLEHLREL
jgi:hypothetical protein